MHECGFTGLWEVLTFRKFTYLLRCPHLGKKKRKLVRRRGENISTDSPFLALHLCSETFLVAESCCNPGSDRRIYKFI